MTYKVEFDVHTFPYWAGAAEHMEEVFSQGRAEEARQIIEDMFEFSEDVTMTDINDFVWFNIAEEMNLYSAEEEEV